MSGYAAVNGNNNIINDFLDIFKKFYNSVKNRFAKNDEMSLEEFINKYSEDKEFLDYLEFVKFSLNEISNIMEQINFEYDDSLLPKFISFLVNDSWAIISYDIRIIKLSPVDLPVHICGFYFLLLLVVCFLLH